MLHQILFFIVAGICVGAAINLLLQRHTINSALSLIVVMGSLAMIYLLLGAEFVAALQVIVYAGAIMVLFVFVIMLLNAGEEERTGGSKVALMFGVPAALLVATLVIWTLTRGQAQHSVTIGNFLGDAHSVSRMLFRQFLVPFEVTSVLILIAIMGAVVLAQRERQ